jgi:hypothetical protein
MNVILPVIVASLFLGLTVRRMNVVHWLLLSLWVAVVIVVYYFKN